MLNRSKLVSRLGYTFSDPSLLERALSHRSYAKENNERLEFLGDSLLSIIITEALYHKFPKAKEGLLTQLRSSLVKGETLTEIANEFELGDCLLLGSGELKSGGFRRPSILENAVEALIGAIYLDSGSDIAVCKSCVLDWFSGRLDRIDIKSESKDPKTRLQEYLQQRRMPLPTYKVVSQANEGQDITFTIACLVSCLDDVVEATASSKRAAEKAAAKQTLTRLGLNA